MHERGQRRCSCTFGDVVGVVKIDAHGLGDLGVGNGDKAVRARAVDVDRLLDRHPHSHAVGKGVGAVCFDQSTRLDREHCRLSRVRDNRDNFRIKTKCIAGRDGAANARATADGDVNRIQIGPSRQKFIAVSGHAPHQFRVIGWHDEKVFESGDTKCFFAGFVKVCAKFNKLSAKGLHRPVLFDRVAARGIDLGHQARSGGRAGLALAVIAARCGANAAHVWMGPLEPIDKGDPTSDLEGAGRAVIFVLNAYLGPDALAEQGPRVLRRRIHVRMDQRRCVL